MNCALDAQRFPTLSSAPARNPARGVKEAGSRWGGAHGRFPLATQGSPLSLVHGRAPPALSMRIGCYTDGARAGHPASVMASGDAVGAPLLWPAGARLAALLPDLLVFRRPRASEPELATTAGVLLSVHVTGEGEGRCAALRTCQTGGC